MRLGRDFFTPVSTLTKKQFSFTPKRDENGRVHVALYSEIFSHAGGAALLTNAAYSELKDDVLSSVETLSPKERVVLDVFEPAESDPFDREAIILGFRRYVNACYMGCRREHLSRIALFSAGLIVGIVLCFLLTNYWEKDLASWIFFVLNTFSTVLIWQFAGYVAFEWNGEVKRLKRLKQIYGIEYEFRLWE